MTITKDDADFLKSIAEKFTENALARNSDAIDTFNRAAMKHPYDTFKLIWAKKKFMASDNLAPEQRAKATVTYCSAALPLLNSTFGEAFTMAALPAEAKTTRAAELCEQLGAKKLADLCRKGMQNNP